MNAWIRAKLLLLAVALLWGSMIVLLGAVQIPLTVWAARTQNQLVKDICYSVWMIQDQACGVILSGHHEATVSAMIGEYYLRGSKTAAGMRRVVDWLFHVGFGQTNHCVKAIEKHDTFRFNGGAASIGFVAYWFNLLGIYRGIQWLN